MARLAIYVRVLARLLCFKNIGMTCFARLVTRKVDGTSGNLTYSGTAVMAIFSEALRHNEMTDHQKYHEANDKQ